MIHDASHAGHDEQRLLSMLVWSQADAAAPPACQPLLPAWGRTIGCLYRYVRLMNLWMSYALPSTFSGLASANLDVHERDESQMEESLKLRATRITDGQLQLSRICIYYTRAHVATPSGMLIFNCIIQASSVFDLLFCA
jgi:hypothetical protein